MIKCSCCGIEKDESMFYKHKNCRGGYRKQCKECSSKKREANKKKWNEKNKVRIGFYSRWVNMQQRCYNKKHRAYKRYGGKGVKCLWNSIEEFKRDMYEGYIEHGDKYGYSIKGTQLDRIDNDGDYCKENCRRVTAKENNPHSLERI